MKPRLVAFTLAAFAALGTLILTGCHAYAKLYPVQGPLMQLSPPPVYTAKVTGGMKVDHFYAVIGGGEKAACDFTGNPPRQRLSDPAAPPSPPPFDMAPAWDTVYGDKFYEAHILGVHAPYYWCSATGDKGTVLHVAVRIGQNPNSTQAQSVKGVVQDDKGNIFKFAL